MTHFTRLIPARQTALAAALVGLVATTASAATILVEAPTGLPSDPTGTFSDSLTSPTAVPALSDGLSTVEGFLFNGSVFGGFRFDRDTLAFTVPVGRTLDALTFTGTLDITGLGGVVVTLDSVEFDLFDASDIGTPLTSFVLSTGEDALAQGATPLGPLGAGDYVLRIKESTTTFMSPSDPLDYELEFSLVPEPGSLALLGLGGLALLRRRR